MNQMNATVRTPSDNRKLCGILLASFGAFIIILFLVLNIIAPENDVEMKPEDASELIECAAEEQYCSFDFDLISRSFASFRYGVGHELYFAVDYDSGKYGIVCLNEEQFGIYTDVVDYTFGDSDKYPGIKRIYGYTQTISDELKGFAIEDFNYFWGEEIVNEDNFYEVFRSFYLDATMQNPNDDSDSKWMVLALGVIALTAGAALLVYNKKVNEKLAESKRASISDELNGGDAETGANGYISGDAYETEVPRSRLLALLCLILGASVGGAFWVLVGLAGYMVGWIGLAIAVFGIFGYTLIYKKIDKFGMIASIIVSTLMVLIATYVTTALSLTISINRLHPGRAEFFDIFVRLPEYLSDNDSWDGFLKDIILGLVIYALVAGSYFGKLFHKPKIQNEEPNK